MTSKGNGFATERGAERARWVTKYRGSGLSLKQFARQHGLRPGQLHYWIYQGAPPPGPRAPVATFQEVRLPTPALSTGSWGAEVGLPNGTTVRLAREADVAWTMALINSLRRPCLP